MSRFEQRLNVEVIKRNYGSTAEINKGWEHNELRTTLVYLTRDTARCRTWLNSTGRTKPDQKTTLNKWHLPKHQPNANRFLRRLKRTTYNTNSGPLLQIGPELLLNISFTLIGSTGSQCRAACVKSNRALHKNMRQNIHTHTSAK